MPKVTLKNVSKRFGKVLAVDNLSLDVEDGELFAIVGPNGCGKTTVLRIIAGLIEPDEGDIYLDDTRVNNLPPVKRGVRMVFQDYALYPHMKVYKEDKNSNLSFALKIRKYLPENIKKSVEQISAKIGISKELYSRRPKELSAGQQQKVAIGRAITLPPKVFLLDEPLAHLDPPARLKIRDEIKSLHKEMKVTTIYVTNDLPEAFAVAERLAVLKEGKVIQVGGPHEVYEHPANDFVSDFLKAYEIFR
ncbi:MAG: ABC transporter ATP-binding protein [Nitrososphaeria archaeon]|jgi:ABC-type sugar transport system ATPase subunit